MVKVDNMDKHKIYFSKVTIGCAKLHVEKGNLGKEGRSTNDEIRKVF